MEQGTLSAKFCVADVPADRDRRDVAESPDRIFRKLHHCTRGLRWESMAYRRYLKDATFRMRTLSENFGKMTDIRAVEILERQHQKLSAINVPFENFQEAFDLIDVLRLVAPVGALDCKMFLHGWRNALCDLADEGDDFLAWQKNLLADDTGALLQNFLKENGHRSDSLDTKNMQVQLAMLRFELSVFTLKDFLRRRPQFRQPAL